MRRIARETNIGGVVIGGDSPVAVQTMTNAPSRDVAGTLAQIREAADRGCRIVRTAVPTLKDIDAFSAIVKASPLPVVADIHFDWRIAVAAINAGAAKIRINPGNIDNWDGIRQILEAANNRRVPIRIGVNGGSIKYKNAADDRPAAEALVAEALGYAARFEEMGFHDIVLSLKSSSVAETLAVNREAARRCDYPLHIGVTEAGVPEDALLKSAVALGALLLDGIGDTVRVSFTGAPEDEVDAARKILRAAGRLRDRPEVISCPTCGRTRIRNLPQIAARVRDAVAGIGKPLTVAVMGCEVNGPGEAAGADLGLAATANGFILFVHGERRRTVPAENAVAALLEEIDKI